MSAIETVLRQPAAQAVGWALLHFVWQGALIGVAAAGALAVLRRSAPDVRYVVSTIALCVMLTLPAVTARQGWRAASDHGPAASRAGLAQSAPNPVADTAPAGAGEEIAYLEAGASANPGRRRGGADPGRIDPWLPVIVFSWLCGVTVLSLRLMSGWFRVQRMKTHGTQPAREPWQLIASRLARRLHIQRGVAVLESVVVDVPTVIGWIRPAVLLPASALSGLALSQLEAILAHELAHIRRHDYLVNLLQTLVETLLFYHPAVWWLSGRIRMERENCCDDLAVSLCGDPFTYAQALANLESQRSAAREFAMAATGGSLLQRIRRVLGAPTHAGRTPGWLTGGVSVLLMLGIAAGVARTEAFGPPHRPTRSSLASQRSEVRPAMLRPAVLLYELRELRWHVVTSLKNLVGSPGPQEPPVPPLPPEPPTPLEPRTPAEPPTPPEPPTSDNSAAFTTERSGQTHARITSQNNGRKLEVRVDGEVEFTDDDADVKRLTPGGLLRIKDDGFLSGVFPGRTVEFSADANGNIRRRYWDGGSERPFEPEGRQWLAQVLPGFIRQTGIGAAARVARILKTRGAAGVLAEISQIEGSWAKRVYFSELLKLQHDAGTTRQVLLRAGRDIDSDFELATLLIQVATLQPLDSTTRAPFFDAVSAVDSDFEHRRTLTALAERTDLTPDVTAGMLASAGGIGSDFELASLLLQVVKQQPIEGSIRGPFFRAVGSIGSSFERGRVLQALARRSDASQETILEVLRATTGVDSSFEASNVLLAVAAAHSVSGTARGAYIDVAEKLGDYEKGRALAALVRSEPRR